MLKNQKGVEIPVDILKILISYSNAYFELGNYTFPRKAGVLHYQRCFLPNLLKLHVFRI